MSIYRYEPFVWPKPQEYKYPCPGSGEKPTNVVHRPPHLAKKYATHSGEGFRSACPVCGKESAIGPTSRLIQKHGYKSDNLWDDDIIYETVYEFGVNGETKRPNTKLLKVDELRLWMMAYLDGLADGGYNKKAGAFKRWMKDNTIYRP